MISSVHRLQGTREQKRLRLMIDQYSGWIKFPGVHRRPGCHAKTLEEEQL